MKIIVVVALIFFSVGLKAQFKKPFFNSLTVESGLPEGNIISSVQDSQGYLWFGTQSGLVRYDGIQLKKYPMPDDNGNPVVFCSIQHLHEDRSGNLWANVALEGLYCLDRGKDAFFKTKFDTATNNIFKNYFIYSWIEEPTSRIHWLLTIDSKTNQGNVFSFDAANNKLEHYSAYKKGNYYIPAYTSADLSMDKSGKIWVTSDSLISQYDQHSKSFIPYSVLPDPTKKLIIDTMTPDPNESEIVWLNSIRSGNDKTPYTRKFFRFNLKSKEYQTFAHLDNDPNSIADNCFHILTDSLKRVWFTTQRGLSRFNSKEGTFTNFPLRLESSLINQKSHVEALASDKDGNLWMAGYFKGLIYFNPSSGLATYYTNTKNEGSLPDHNGINKIFYDRSGSLWLNMPYFGIASLDRQKSMLNPIDILPPMARTDRIPDNHVYEVVGILGDSVGFVKDTSTLYSWHFSDNRFRNIDLKEKKIYKQISCVTSGRDRLIWIGSNGTGLFSYDPGSKKIKHYNNDPKDSLSLSSNYVNQLAEDTDGNLWVGTGNAGLCRFNSQTGTFIRYPFLRNNGSLKVKNVLDDISVLSLKFDNEGILWIGTNLGGLNRLDTKTNKFVSYSDFKSGLTCVISIYEDKHNRLWAGTYLSGLFLINKTTGDFKRFSENDGLLYNGVSGIAEDKAGNLWISSPRGLSKLNPENKQFTNFHLSIKSPNINGSIIFAGQDGQLHLPLKGGLISFNPDQLKVSEMPPAVVIESLNYPEPKLNKDTVLFTYGKQKAVLQYDENKISFQYVALHYANPALNKYAYYLEGYDKNWVQAGTQKSATFTNLSPGNYVFHVKASNSDGIWNETDTGFPVTILPPWWKTWWAYLIYGILILIVIRITHQLQKERTIRVEREKTQQRELEQAREIERAYTDLKATQSQLIQSEKMASLGELTAGIAHEIQNPLNFVNNFSEVNTELIEELKGEMDKGNMDEAKTIANYIADNERKINHHGRRADSIVKGMLQHSRSSTGQKEPSNINTLADEYLRLAYHGLRAKDKLFNATLKTDFDQSLEPINIIPQDIGRVMLNLITNAFYAVTEKKLQVGNGYEPTVSITTKKRGNKVVVSVCDNGYGVPLSVISKIFQPFFTTKPTGKGTGLGLSMSYDIIKAHGGDLKVETKEGEGAEFLVELPLE